MVALLAAPPLNSSVRNLSLVFFTGLILGGGAVWLWFSGPTSAPAPLETESGGQPPVSFAESVFVRDQRAGIVVAVDSVTLSASSWVAIHESEEGVPGNILGAQRFDPGTHSGNVDLLRETVPGGSYFAMLHRDNGDGAFSPASDLPVTHPDGEAIATAFAALNE